MRTEIASLAALDEWLANGRSLVGCVLKDLPLAAFEAALVGAELTGTVFLGCQLTPAELAAAQAHRALVFPPIEDLPFDPYRTSLYGVDDLYGGFDPGAADGYERTLDACIDRWGREHGSVDVLDALCRRLHDHAITEAVADFVAGHRVAGVMGGHEVRRDEPTYREVAGIGRELQRAGLLVATGGGPGAMEAANLGAFCGPHPDAVLDEAIALLAGAPAYDDRPRWLAAGLAVRARWLAGCGSSLGIPTWHYGHEPPTPFATHIAKYFDNSVREDGLLTIAGAGIIFTPGMSGTVQELFQDGSQNCYAEPGHASPMVLYGSTYWTETIAAALPLRQLAAGTEAEALVLVTDDPAEAVAALVTARSGGAPGTAAVPT